MGMNQGINVKVLVVDDEKTVRDFLVRLLKFESIEAKAVEGCAQAIDALRSEKFDIVFMDIRMPDIDGIRAYAELRQIDPELACVFMTGYALEQELLDKIKDPSVVCLKKPFQDISQIKKIVRNILINRRPKEDLLQNPKLQRTYSRINISLKVEYRVKGKDGLFSFFLTRDISAGGMQVILSEQLAVGTELELIIHSLQDEETCKAIAEIKSCERTDEPAGSYLAGVKFKEIDLSELTTLLSKFGKI